MEKLASFLASTIDHTCLKSETCKADIETLCKEAKDFGMVAVCVRGQFVEYAKELLKGTTTKIVTVVGFPSGEEPTEKKVQEAKVAVSSGADEIDMVICISKLKSGDDDAVAKDIRLVVDAVRPIPVKVILETAILTDNQKISGCKLAETAGATFVKTSTGFASGGATVYDVELIKKSVSSKMGIKASGGIRTLKDSLDLLQAGATRIGTSHSVAILNELKAAQKE